MGCITLGHAKVLASEKKEKQLVLLKKIKEKKLSVRELESLLSFSNKDKYKEKKTSKTKEIEKKITGLIGMKTVIKQSNKKGKGKIVLEYDNDEIFETFIKKIQA